MATDDPDQTKAPSAFPDTRWSLVVGVRPGAADEVSAIDGVAKKPCAPQFATRGVISPGDPRDWRGLDIIGVIDLDGDGRFEHIEPDPGLFLDLVAEGQPWPRPAVGPAQNVTGADLPTD